MLIPPLSVAEIFPTFPGPGDWAIEDWGPLPGFKVK